MSEVLESMLKEILECDISAEIDGLISFTKEVKEYCVKQSIPFAKGVVSNTRKLVTVDAELDMPFLEWMSVNRPSFVAMECHEGTLNYSEGVLFDFLIGHAESVGKEVDVKEFQEKCAGKYIAVVVHLIFNESLVRVKYTKNSKLRAICSIEPVQDDDGEDDDWDSAYIEPVYLTDEEINGFSKKLALHEDFYLAKNIGERKSLASKVLDAEISDYDLGKIARESASVYKIEILPKRVEEMLSQDKDHKEMAEILGESQSKIKQIIAVMKAKEAFKDID